MCSSLVVKALQKGGLPQYVDPALAFPADLARVFDARLCLLYERPLHQRCLRQDQHELPGSGIGF